jgi:hypothetical protein
LSETLIKAGDKLNDTAARDLIICELRMAYPEDYPNYVEEAQADGNLIKSSFRIESDKAQAEIYSWPT